MKTAFKWTALFVALFVCIVSATFVSRYGGLVLELMQSNQCIEHVDGPPLPDAYKVRL